MYFHHMYVYVCISTSMSAAGSAGSEAGSAGSAVSAAWSAPDTPDRRQPPLRSSTLLAARAPPRLFQAALGTGSRLSVEHLDSCPTVA